MIMYNEFEIGLYLLVRKWTIFDANVTTILHIHRLCLCVHSINLYFVIPIYFTFN